MGNIKVDLSGMKALNEQISRLGARRNELFTACAKELAARLLRSVIKRTPVGVPPSDISPDVYDEYWSGYTGGTLRRGWTAKSEAEAQSGGKAGLNAGFLNTLAVKKTGNVYTITITNPVKYASYVEYGHRQHVGQFVPALGKKLKRGWVEGQFMLKISEEELQIKAPAILEAKIKRWLIQNAGGM